MGIPKSSRDKLCSVKGKIKTKIIKDIGVEDKIKKN